MDPQLKLLEFSTFVHHAWNKTLIFNVLNSLKTEQNFKDFVFTFLLFRLFTETIANVTTSLAIDTTENFAQVINFFLFFCLSKIFFFSWVKIYFFLLLVTKYSIKLSSAIFLDEFKIQGIGFKMFFLQIYL